MQCYAPIPATLSILHFTSHFPYLISSLFIHLPRRTSPCPASPSCHRPSLPFFNNPLFIPSSFTSPHLYYIVTSQPSLPCFYRFPSLGHFYLQTHHSTHTNLNSSLLPFIVYHNHSNLPQPSNKSALASTPFQQNQCPLSMSDHINSPKYHKCMWSHVVFKAPVPSAFLP